jgi:quaternary ammonium compound-resistance protein SugE
MAWFYLIVAGLLEIGWAVGLKYTMGFSRLWPSVATLCTMVASFGFLALALKQIPLGTGYAVWTGIGAAGTAIIGMVYLGESREILRIACIGLIVAGVMGLKFASASGHG